MKLDLSAYLYRVRSLLILAIAFELPIRSDADEKGKDVLGAIAFSIKRWEGNYVTSDTDASKNTPCTGGIWIANLQSGKVQEVVDTGGMTANPIFSPDGRWLYFQSNGTGQYEIYRCRPDGSQVQNLTAPHNADHQFESYGFSISSDGSKVLHTIHDGKVAKTAIMDAAGGNRHPIEMPGVDYFYMGALSPDSTKMAFANVATDYSLMLVDLASGKPQLLEKGVPSARCIVPQFTPDGRQILYLKTDGDMYSLELNEFRSKQLTHGNRYNTFYLSSTDEHGSSDPPNLSPDGKRVAFVAQVENRPQVFTMNLDGSDRRQITSRSAACGRVKWSPDGAQLAFVSFEDRYPQLFVVASTGGEPRKLTSLPAAVYFLSWQPNHVAR